MNKRILACLFLCALLFLAACAPIASPNLNELLRAPALGAEQGKMQKALADYLGAEPEYKFPKEGSWHSPLIVADLDGNGTSECVLLYSLAANATAGHGVNVYIAVLEQRDGEWVVTQGDIEGPSTEVASLEVAPLYGGKSRQLIIGFTTQSLNPKTLVLYEYKEGVLFPVKQMPYSRYQLADFSGNGGTELVVVSPDDQSQGLQLWYLPVTDGKFADAAPITLDPSKNVRTCDGLYPGVDAEGNRLLVIDGSTDQSMTLSQIAHFSGDHFYIIDDAGAMLAATSRKNPLLLLRSRDIDGDKIIEIPLRVGKNEITTPRADKRLEYVEWMDFTGEEPVRKEFGILDSSRGVYVRLPDEWLETTRVRDGAGAGEWAIEDARSLETFLTVRELDSGEQPPQDALLVSRVTNTYLIFSGHIRLADRQKIKATSMV